LSRERTHIPPEDTGEQPRINAPVVIEDEPWDLTDRLNPQPLVYPVCPECKAPWHYTWAWVIGESRGQVERWCWTRPPGVPKGCRHRGRPLVYHVQTGELSPMPDSTKDRPEDHGG
jgi:hypothetical protein